MALTKHKDGNWYGTIPVMLVREWGAEMQVLYATNTIFGDSIMVATFEDKLYLEKPLAWWEQNGFTLVEPPFAEHVRHEWLPF